MVSISRNNRNNKDGPTLPFLYFCLGAIFMSLFGRLSTMMNVSSGKAYRNELDPHAILLTDNAPKQQQHNANDNHNEAEGGLPNLNPNQEYQHFVDELKKKQTTITELEDKYEQAQTQLKEQAEKIAKYESVVDELYKSRRRYGQSEEQKESLNVTLLRVEDKMEQVRSILRGGANSGATTKNDPATPQGGDDGGAR